MFLRKRLKLDGIAQMMTNTPLGTAAPPRIFQISFEIFKRFKQNRLF